MRNQPSLTTRILSKGVEGYRSLPKTHENCAPEWEGIAVMLFPLVLIAAKCGMDWAQ